MSDVETMTADQPQSADNSDFLGDLDLDGNGGNEPSTAPEAEQVDDSAEPEAAAEGEQQSVEDSDDWLPSEQEKEFPPEVLAKYAKRYGYTQDEIATDPRVARIVKDKINSDILIQQKMQEKSATVEEPTLKETETEPVTQADQTQDYDKYLDGIISQFDQKAVEKFGQGLWESMGGTPEQLKELGIDSSKIGGTLARGAIDMIATALPQLMPQVVESVFPGFARMYESAMYAQQWDTVRSIKEKDGSQPYAKLPAYGTEQFQTALRDAAAQIPGFDQMVFTGKNGKSLPAHEQARQKYALLAKIAAGQNVAQLPAVKQAVETGKKLAKEADRSRQNAKILGAGQSSNSLTQKRTNNDDIFGEGSDEYRRREKF